MRWEIETVSESRGTDTSPPGGSDVSGPDGIDPAGASSGRVAEPTLPVGEDKTVAAAGPRRRREIRLEKVWQLARAVADADPGKIESAARQFGESRPYLAPVAWAAGTIVLLIRGVKLLVLNWRLSLIQLVPAGWIWLVMWDLKQHALRGAPFRHVTLGGVVLVVALTVVVSTAAFWCNTVFAFAIDVLPPQIRPAIRHTNRHLARYRQLRAARRRGAGVCRRGRATHRPSLALHSHPRRRTRRDADQLRRRARAHHRS